MVSMLMVSITKKITQFPQRISTAINILTIYLGELGLEYGVGNVGKIKALSNLRFYPDGSGNRRVLRLLGRM